MTSRGIHIVAGSALLLLAGCANVSVYDPKGGQLKGIPFYIKVPVITQETKLAKSELQVQIVVSDVTVPTAVLATRFPASGPLKLSPDSKAAVDLLLADLIDQATGKSFEETKVLAARVSNALDGLPKPSAPRTLTNSWTVNMVVGPNAYYITNYMPLIGSVTADYKFAPDGTLTEASGTTQDDTVKTVLSLFPITAKIAQDWNVKTDKTGGSTAKTEGAGRATGAPGKVKLEITSNEAKTIFTLRKNIFVDDTMNMRSYFGGNAKLEPLKYSDAQAGTNGVQLIAEETGADSAKENKGDSKSYQLSGTITPPSTDAGAATAGGAAPAAAQGTTKGKAK